MLDLHSKWTPTRRQTWLRYGTKVLVALAVLLLAAVFWVVISLDRLILDCTKQTGDCYKANTTRTGQIIGNVNEISILAAACAAYTDPPTVDLIRACVESEYLKTHPSGK